jgi:hypothetical protein
MGWSGAELDVIGATVQVDLATERADGSLRRPVTVWVVRVGDELYVRAVHGPQASWYRGARTRSAGVLWADRVKKPVRFAAAEDGVGDRVDAAYREKYGSFGPTLDLALATAARAATLRLVPA